MKHIFKVVKHLFTIVIFLLVIEYGYGQNTFPSSGNVGIGTTSPGTRLEIAGSNTVVNVSNFADQDFHITLSSPGAVSPKTVIGPGTAGRFSLGVVGNEQLTIINGGNVGIGTINPEVKLQVDVNSSVTDYSQIPTSLSLRNNSSLEGNLNVLCFRDADGWGLGGIAVQNKNVGSHTGVLSFWTRNNGATTYPRMTLDENGKVGIGTTSPDQLLTVNGTIHSKEVKVDLSVPAPDYVFNKDYNLPSLEEIKTYIDENKHLPEVPSAKEMEANGVQLGEMSMLLLKKIEELTLYTMKVNKENEELRIRMTNLENHK